MSRQHALCFRISLGVALLAAPSVARAQFQRIVPPPPCVIPTSLQVRGATRSPNDKRPFIVVETIDVSNTERRAASIPWDLTKRIRNRLGRLNKLNVATEGTFERSLYEAGGSADSAASLLRADWMLRGRSNTVMGGTAVILTLLHRGVPGAAWSGTFRVPSQAPSEVEETVAKAVVGRVLGEQALPPPADAGEPKSVSSQLAMAATAFALRESSLGAADSARVILERTFASDTSSPALAVALANAYVAVITRGAGNSPIARAAALRRIDELLKFALARDARRSDAWTTRAVAARLRDTVSFKGALEAHMRALSFSPRSADASEALANTYIALGDDDKAATELRRVLTYDAERGTALRSLGAIELRARRYASACAYSNAAVASAMFDAQAYAVRARARLHLGQARDAYADAETAALLSGEPWTDGLRLMTEIGAGNTDGAWQLGKTLAQRYLGPGKTLAVNDAVMLAAGWIQLGDTARGLDALSRARPRGRMLTSALRDPVFDVIRQDPAFKALNAPPTLRSDVRQASP